MKFLSDYLNWHYFEVWPRLLILWRNLTIFPIYFFSVPLHLATLFSPWKRQVKKMGIGFHLDDFFATFGFNLISRTLGCLIRTVIIVYGILFSLLCVVIGGLVSILWVIIPFATIIFYLFRQKSEKEEFDKILKKANRHTPKLACLLFSTKAGYFVSTHLGFHTQKLIEVFANIHEEGDFPRLEKLLANNKSLTFPSLFQALSLTFTPLINLLERYKISDQDVYETALWYDLLEKKKENPLLSDLSRIRSMPGIGSSWGYGYTVEFDKYSEDLTQRITPFPLLVGREKELENMERVLLKTEDNNILIVGEPGVARHRLVETFAHRILLGKCHPFLSHKRLLQLNLASIVSSKPSILEARGLVEEIIFEAQNAGNIIAVIDDIDKFLSNDEGRIDLSDIFIKFAESQVGFIGITTPFSYHKYIDNNPNLSPHFEKIDILPPPLPVVLQELEISIVPVLEKKNRIVVTYPALKKAIEDSDRFISETPFPAKTIELLDAVTTYVSTQKNERIIQPENIDEFLSIKYHTNLGTIESSEKEKLLRLEELLHKRIINQEEAIRAVSSSLRRHRVDITNRNRPIGSFLFLGPTGVGKTETAKALSEIYYGREDSMLRFDMSQYQKEEGLERLIGSIKLGTSGELTAKLLDRPFSLLLLDEFEKGDRDLYNLFLTLFDEGYITSAGGKKVNAKNTIVIATSNAGAEFIREKIKQGFSSETLKKELIEYVQKEKIFSPELLNRFDGVVVFTPLTEGHLREVARLQLENLNKRLISQKISINITSTLVRKLAIIGFDPEFGGRAMRRVITEKIEDDIAKRILEGRVKKGEKIEIEL